MLVEIDRKCRTRASELAPFLSVCRGVAWMFVEIDRKCRNRPVLNCPICRGDSTNYSLRAAHLKPFLVFNAATKISAQPMVP